MRIRGKFCGRRTHFSRSAAADISIIPALCRKKSRRRKQKIRCRRIFYWLFYGFEDLLEHFRFVLGEIREDLAVDRDLFLFERRRSVCCKTCFPSRAAALIFTLQSRRAVRFFSLRPRNAWLHAWSNASFAARSFDLRPQRKPFVYFKILWRCFVAPTPRFTLGMLVVDYFSDRIIERPGFPLLLDLSCVLPGAEMVRCHRPADDLAILRDFYAFCERF